MLSLRTNRLPAFPSLTGTPARAHPSRTTRRASVVATPARWRSDAVQWGVVRAQGCFDVGDTARHRGLVQHAFPLGRDELAVCGFRTPLRRAFDGTRRPLLALPGSDNPGCPRCLAQVTPPGAEHPADDPSQGVGGWLHGRLGMEPRPVAEPRPERALVAIGIEPEPEDGLSWPARDLQRDGTAAASQHADAAWPASTGEIRRRVIEQWRHAAVPHRPVAIPIETGVVTAGPIDRRAVLAPDPADALDR